MKQKYFYLLLLLASLLPINLAMAVTAVTLSTPEQISNVSQTQFGLTGSIDNYEADLSLIVINGITYTLSGKGDLSDADLTVGRVIKYNVEKSTDEEQGRVTRIWIEQ